MYKLLIFSHACYLMQHWSPDYRPTALHPLVFIPKPNACSSIVVFFKILVKSFIIFIGGWFNKLSSV